MSILKKEKKNALVLHVFLCQDKQELFNIKYTLIFVTFNFQAYDFRGEQYTCWGSKSSYSIITQ